MNSLMNRRLTMFDRVDEFVAQSGLTLKARSTALIGQIRSVRDEMLAQAAAQNGGYSVARAGVSDRLRTATDLRERLIEIAQTARSLDPGEFPAAAALVRVTKSRGYQALRANAQAFLDGIAPIKAALIEREYPADFDEQIQALITQLDAATQRKHSGSRERVESTAELEALSRKGLGHVRELNASLSKMLKVSSPGQYAAWKAASRVERAPRRSQPGDPANAAAPAPPSPAPSSAPAPTPAA
jgi:hypothetical protein